MTKNKNIKITLVKSPIGYKEKAKKTLEALGLRRMNQSIEHNSNDSIMGMIKIVDYLIKVEEV